MAEFLALLSQILGWGYFLSWSSSFYPQVLLNYKRKSVHGLSKDFLYYNVIGFFCYSIYTISFYSSETIREQYRLKHDGKDNLVMLNDTVFATHAFLIASFTLYQTFIYKSVADQSLSKVGKYVVLGSIATSLSCAFLASANLITWLNALYTLSWIKFVISIIKYIPQAYLNYCRQSTVGWSIENILLDFTGGTLSIGQLLLDGYRSNDMGGVFGNPIKLALGNLSMGFDTLFMVQHYILYKNRTNDYDQVDSNNA